MNGLPKKLKLKRKQQGLTQAQLSARVGITQAFLAEIESGRKRPSIEVLEKLCDTLGCSADYLLGIEQSRRYKTLEQPALPSSLTSRGITPKMLEEMAERNISGEELSLAIKLIKTMNENKKADTKR
ncbi:MAG: helix-turn-helix transcriptional regulator [Christensenellales bacterium]